MTQGDLEQPETRHWTLRRLVDWPAKTFNALLENWKREAVEQMDDASPGSATTRGTGRGGSCGLGERRPEESV